MTLSAVSVVIPAFNARKTIGLTISAVLAQNYKINEIIVVDDGSSDRTAEIVRSFLKVKYIFQDNAGPAAARNRGAQEAKGEIIFFTDSDCIPQKTWIEKSIAHFQKLDVAAVAGSYGIANPESRLARCIQDEIIYRHQYLMPDYPQSFGSYNVGIRKNTFDQVGGFNLVYRYASGEDNDLSYKIIKAGHKIYFERASYVLHFHTEGVRKYLQEQARHGFWRMKMYLDHPQMMKGDGYTFWKDSAEVFLVFFLTAILILNPFVNFILTGYSVIFVVFLALLQIYFSLTMMKRKQDALFFAYVMFLRSITRSYGFFKGFFSFLTNNYNKK